MDNATPQKKTSVPELLLMAAGAVLMGFTYEIFILPNSFAPAGINGIATMLQYLLHVNIGWLSLVFNLPLLLLAWRSINRDYAVKSLVYLLVFSLTTILLGRTGLLTGLVYHTENGNSAILGPIAAGTVAGIVYGTIFHYNGSSGGTDILSAWIRTKRPEANLIWLIFSMNAVVAVMSFFVYHFRYEPVIMCLIYCFISASLSDRILRGITKAYKFEVITDHMEELSAELMREMHHGVTMVRAEGMYSKQEKELLICVVNRQQLVYFRRILARYPGTFSYVSEVIETVGNFRKVSRPLLPERPPRSGRRA